MTDDRVIELLDLIIYKTKDGYGNLNQSITSNAREARAIMLNRARTGPHTYVDGDGQTQINWKSLPPTKGEPHGFTTTTEQ